MGAGFVQACKIGTTQVPCVQAAVESETSAHDEACATANQHATSSRGVCTPALHKNRRTPGARLTPWP